MTSERALSGNGAWWAMGLALLAGVGWYAYSIGHTRGERAGIREIRDLYGKPPGHVLLQGMYFEGLRGDDRPAITVRDDKYGASEVVLEDWHCRRVPPAR